MTLSELRTDQVFLIGTFCPRQHRNIGVLQGHLSIYPSIHPPIGSLSLFLKAYCTCRRPTEQFKEETHSNKMSSVWENLARSERTALKNKAVDSLGEAIWVLYVYSLPWSIQEQIEWHACNEVVISCVNTTLRLVIRVRRTWDPLPSKHEILPIGQWR